MSKRYDVLSPRKRQDKTYWHKVGSAWEGAKGINIVLDSLPLPDAEGRVSISLFEPREKSEAPASSAPRSGAAADLND